MDKLFWAELAQRAKASAFWAVASFFSLSVFLFTFRSVAHQVEPFWVTFWLIYLILLVFGFLVLGSDFLALLEDVPLKKGILVLLQGGVSGFYSGVGVKISLVSVWASLLFALLPFFFLTLVWMALEKRKK